MAPTMDFINILQGFVNMTAVLIAVVITQSIKYWLPSPMPGPRTSEIVPGHLMTRLMPFVPLIIGAISCVLLEWKPANLAHEIARGINSGAFAAYLYRTTKVTIFGE